MFFKDVFQGIDVLGNDCVWMLAGWEARAGGALQGTAGPP